MFHLKKYSTSIELHLIKCIEEEEEEGRGGEGTT